MNWAVPVRIYALQVKCVWFKTVHLVKCIMWPPTEASDGFLGSFCAKINEELWSISIMNCRAVSGLRVLIHSLVKCSCNSRLARAVKWPEQMISATGFGAGTLSVLIPKRPEVTGHRNCLLCWNLLLEDGLICPFPCVFPFVSVPDRRPEGTGAFEGKRLFQGCLIGGWALKHWMLHVGHEQSDSELSPHEWMCPIMLASWAQCREIQSFH